MRRKPPYVAINLLNKVTRMNKEGKKDTDSKRPRQLLKTSWSFHVRAISRRSFCEQLQFYALCLQHTEQSRDEGLIYYMNLNDMCREWTHNVICWAWIYVIYMCMYIYIIINYYIFICSIICLFRCVTWFTCDFSGLAMRSGLLETRLRFKENFERYL